MNPIVYVNTDIKKAYYDESFLGKVKDRLHTSFEGESFIKELDLKIACVKLPPNFNPKAYRRNIQIAKKYIKKRQPYLALKTYRYLDFQFLNDFQKKLFAYGVVNSIKLILRLKNKSIKSSCIVVYDAAEDINQHIIYELSKECKYCILLSNNITFTSNLREYIIANYGISPIVTNDVEYALKKSDFVISSKNLEIDNLVWYIDNLFLPSTNKDLAINDISFSVPWDIKDINLGFELVGAILSQMNENDIEASLKYNGIYLDKIKFNEEIKNF
ncbi:hypothetical protein SAMN05428976_10813 [Clostridium sp. USBA 49]|jgi:hypothetical protein|uniref:hypothetical protein n=1 Tax=Clostridium TaxID=1485 RepID=UPI00099B06EE|nr:MULTISPECIES: hypothetical protein [Clostridium]SKA85826.1 hypothetical protein SAMN05428976_10813 [Clostridium sp. USBA 49]